MNFLPLTGPNHGRSISFPCSQVPPPSSSLVIVPHYFFPFFPLSTRMTTNRVQLPQSSCLHFPWISEGETREVLNLCAQFPVGVVKSVCQVGNAGLPVVFMFRSEECDDSDLSWLSCFTLSLLLCLSLIVLFPCPLSTLETLASTFFAAPYLFLRTFQSRFVLIPFLFTL